MSNNFRGTAPLVSVDEEGAETTHILTYDANALCSFEKETEITMGGIVEHFTDQSKMSMTFVRAMLWAGLLKTNRKITLDDAGDILSGAGMEESVKAIHEAFGSATRARKAGAPGK